MTTVLLIAIDVAALGVLFACAIFRLARRWKPF